MFITSAAKVDVAIAAVANAPKVEVFLVVDSDVARRAVPALRRGRRRRTPTRPIPDEQLGAAMLYSSGTTGRPKGILRPLPENRPAEPLPVMEFVMDMFRFREGMTYLSPAPLYHSAPQASVSLALRLGATSVIMERFDPEQYLDCVQRHRITNCQVVPTMFSRMLKLPDDVRLAYDLSSLESIVHAAAPCPVPVKEAMIEWFGPKIIEYYGATEANGFTFCDTEEWLAHQGTVGKPILGELLILDDDGNPQAKGEPGTVWFRGAPTSRTTTTPTRRPRAATPPARRAASATSATSTTTATCTSPTARRT